LKGLSTSSRVDWQNLKRTIHSAIRFLDDVIEVNSYPLEQIQTVTLANRKIGLGIMGFADMLIQLGIPYDSAEACGFAGKLMRFIRKESIAESVALAKERGIFPNFSKSIYAKDNLRLRNATVNTIAPTGTISIIAGCSSGIEPLFAICFMRNVLSGAKLFEVNSLFEAVTRDAHIHDKQILAQIARQGSVQGIKAIPQRIRKVFVTAFDIKPVAHLRIQAAFQKYTDNAVSKTVNLSSDASVEDVRDIYLMAHKLKCKGITVYRYGSRAEQVLSLGHGEAQAEGVTEFISAGAEYSGGCVASRCAF